jgi:hypothetical protein
VCVRLRFFFLWFLLVVASSGVLLSFLSLRIVVFALKALWVAVEAGARDIALGAEFASCGKAGLQRQSGSWKG